MRPFRVVAPQGVLVPWAAADGLAVLCGLEPDDERQGLVEGFERAAVAYFDGYSGRLKRCILRQKWALPLIGNPEAVNLPFPDCREFEIERREDDLSWTPIEDVTIKVERDRVWLTDLPQDSSGLHLTCWAGWETPAEVDQNLVQAVRLLVAHWFDNRSAVSAGPTPHEVPLGVDAMASPLIHNVV